jgi:hypothetical protein
MSSGSVRPPEQPPAEPSGEELEAELARVRTERDKAMARLDKREERRRIGGPARRIIVGILVALAAILIPVTATVTWVHRTVVNTDTYVSTVGPVINDPAVQSTLARVATNQLFDALDPQPAIADALPPRAAFLAGPITNGVKGFVQDQANNVLASSQFQQVWLAANRTAHAAIMRVLRGESKALTESNGQVVLSVVPLLNEVLQRVQQTASGITGKDIKLPTLTGNELPSEACAKISSALNRPLPSTCGQIPLFPADKLDQAQWAIRAFDRATLALLIITPLLFIAALLITRRRRRTLLQLTVGALLVMVILRRVMFWLQDKLISTGQPQNKDARSAIIHQVLHGFFTVSLWVLWIGVAIVVIALVTGPYRWAVRSRSWVAATSSVAWRQIRDAVTGREVAGAWVRAHLDLLRIAGGLLALLLILVLNVSWVWLLVILVLLGGYEFWLYRLGESRRRAAATTSGAESTS